MLPLVTVYITYCTHKLKVCMQVCMYMEVLIQSSFPWQDVEWYVEWYG